MNGLAMITVLVAVGSSEANRVMNGKKLNSSPVIGGFLLGVFLFAFLMMNPQLGTKFCYLVIVASLLTNGNGLLKAMSVQPAAAARKTNTTQKVVKA